MKQHNKKTPNQIGLNTEIAMNRSVLRLISRKILFNYVGQWVIIKYQVLPITQLMQYIQTPWQQIGSGILNVCWEDTGSKETWSFII